MIIIAYIAQLGAIIRDLRDARSMPQETLAFIAGIDGAQVSKYERGLVVPSLAILIRVLRSLGQRLTVTPELFVVTAAERDAVIAAAVEHVVGSKMAPTSDRLHAAVGALVTAEIDHLKRGQAKS